MFKFIMNRFLKSPAEKSTKMFKCDDKSTFKMPACMMPNYSNLRMNRFKNGGRKKEQKCSNLLTTRVEKERRKKKYNNAQI